MLIVYNRDLISSTYSNNANANTANVGAIVQLQQCSCAALAKAISYRCLYHAK